MIFDFLNFGLLFVILAIFGFIVKDIVNLSQYWNLPDDYKKDTERFFNYIATALLIIAFTTILITPLLTSKESNSVNDLFKVTGTTIDKLHEARLISNETYSGIVEGFTLGIISTVYFSYLYIIIYAIAFLFGIFLRYSKTYGISVVLKSKPDSPEIFRDLIRESDEFLFFETDSAFASWTAIRKDEVSRMEMIDLPSRTNIYFKKLGDIIFTKFPKYNYLNSPITVFFIIFVIGGVILSTMDIFAGLIFFIGALIVGILLYKRKNMKSY
jgi:hypothetical protein